MIWSEGSLDPPPLSDSGQIPDRARRRRGGYDWIPDLLGRWLLLAAGMGVRESLQ